MTAGAGSPCPAERIACWAVPIMVQQSMGHFCSAATVIKTPFAGPDSIESSPAISAISWQCRGVAPVPRVGRWQAMGASPGIIADITDGIAAE